MCTLLERRYCRYKRQHIDINIIVFPARFISDQIAIDCTLKFLNTSFDANRHIRRIDKIEIQDILLTH